MKHFTGKKTAELFGQKLMVSRAFLGSLIQQQTGHSIGAEAEKGVQIRSCNGRAGKSMAEKFPEIGVDGLNKKSFHLSPPGTVQKLF